MIPITILSEWPAYKEAHMTPETRRTTGLTWPAVFMIVACGALYQYYYNWRKERYREVITDYYWKYFDRAPDAPGLDHWTM